jgi:hypothetical protein
MPSPVLQEKHYLRRWMATSHNQRWRGACGAVGVHCAAAADGCLSAIAKSASYKLLENQHRIMTHGKYGQGRGVSKVALCRSWRREQQSPPGVAPTER